MRMSTSIWPLPCGGHPGTRRADRLAPPEKCAPWCPVSVSGRLLSRGAGGGGPHALEPQPRTLCVPPAGLRRGAGGPEVAACWLLPSAEARRVAVRGAPSHATRASAHQRREASLNVIGGLRPDVPSAGSRGVGSGAAESPHATEGQAGKISTPVRGTQVGGGGEDGVTGQRWRSSAAWASPTSGPAP